MLILIDSSLNPSKSDPEEIQDVIIIGEKNENLEDKSRKENRFRLVPVRKSNKQNNDEEGWQLRQMLFVAIVFYNVDITAWDCFASA